MDLQADTTWFHVLRVLLFSGEAARMGGNGFLVYCAIKAHTDFATGASSPGVERLANLTGLSRMQVNREQRKLMELGYLSKSKAGRRNVYRLTEKALIVDGEGKTRAIAEWPYTPSQMEAMRQAVKEAVIDGLEGAQGHIAIGSLQINVQIGDGNTMIPAQGTAVETVIKDLPEGPLRRAMTRLQGRIKGNPEDT